MRIISGSHRGRQIHPPKNFKARPTTDFAKESLFNIINNHFDYDDLKVLDLFSGTGSISYEFASRGAKEVTSIELDRIHYKFVLNSVQDLALDQVKVLQYDAFRYLLKPTSSYNIIFADPPYDHEKLDKLPDMVFETKILNDGGWFILEHPGKFSFTAHSRFLQHRKYGGVEFSIFK